MASSVTNTTFMVGNGFSADGQNPTDLLAAAYRKTRQPAVDALQTAQNKLSSRQIFYNTLRTKLETVQTASTNLTDATAAAKYTVKKVSSSDATVATATATSAATLGTSSVKVDRLASNDTLLTDSISRTELFSTTVANRSGFFVASEENESFTIGGRNYSVAYDSSTDTAESMMKKVVAAISADTSATVSANYIQDTSTTGRISFASKQSGTTNRITFDNTSTIMKGLGLESINQKAEGSYAVAEGLDLDRNAFNSIATENNQSFGFKINGKTYSVSLGMNTKNSTLVSTVAATISSNAPANVAALPMTNGQFSRLEIRNSLPGGSISIEDTDGLLAYLGIPTQEVTASRAVGTSVKAGYVQAFEWNLDAKATVNGVAVTRSTNTLSDVLPGMSINLLKAQGSADAAAQLTVSTDTDSVISTIQPLIDSYNDALRYVQGNLRTNAGNDSSIRNLQSQLRGLSSTMFGSSSSSMKYLTDIGIKIDKDGMLSVGDKDKLKSAITDNNDQVQAIFSGSTGLASRLQTMVSGYVGSDGLATSRSKVLGTQISASTTKITQLKARIDKEVDQQLKDYKKLQESFYRLQGQMSQYSASMY